MAFLFHVWHWLESDVFQNLCCSHSVFKGTLRWGFVRNSYNLHAMLRNRNMQSDQIHDVNRIIYQASAHASACASVTHTCTCAHAHTYTHYHYLILNRFICVAVWSMFWWKIPPPPPVFDITLHKPVTFYVYMNLVTSELYINSENVLLIFMHSLHMYLTWIMC
jgi:hypothetical protein